MTKFLFEPFEKIIVKNLVHEDPDNLIHQVVTNRTRSVYWVNGMIIHIPTLIYGAGKPEYKNMEKGIQYFQKVVFAKFPKYVPSITQKNCANYIALLNYSNNDKIKELSNWIESHPIWKTIPEPARIEGINIDE